MLEVRLGTLRAAAQRRLFSPWQCCSCTRLPVTPNFPFPETRPHSGASQLITDVPRHAEVRLRSPKSPRAPSKCGVCQAQKGTRVTDTGNLRGCATLSWGRLGHRRGLAERGAPRFRVGLLSGAGNHMRIRGRDIRQVSQCGRTASWHTPDSRSRSA